MNKDNNIKNIVINHISKTINEDKNKIKLKSKINDFSNWDSISHINIILGISKKFNIKVNSSKYFELDSVELNPLRTQSEEPAALAG